MVKKHWNRRDLIKSAAAASLTAGLAVPAGSTSTVEARLEKRPFGRGGDPVTLLGLGGVYVGRRGGSEETALATIRRALGWGINYIDTATQYGNGLSEMNLGKVLSDGWREKVFLATKTLQRSYEDSKREIRGSLRRLRTDKLDLLQIHSINDMETLIQVTGKNGSLRAALDAKDEGLTRYVGITGHTRPGVLVEALKRHDFDSVLVPLGPADVHLGDFLADLVPVAKEKGCAVVAMKVLAAGRSVGKLPVRDCLHYAMSLPTSTTIVGMGTPEEVDENVRHALRFKPWEPQRRAALEKEAKPLGTADTLWWKNRG